MKKISVAILIHPVKFGSGDKRIVVAGAVQRQLFILNRLLRAPLETRHALFAVMMPYGTLLPVQRDIRRRADAGTEPAAVAGVRSPEKLIGGLQRRPRRASRRTS